MMKLYIKNILLILFAMIVLACETDVEKIRVNGFEAATLTATKNSVVITPDDHDELVLSFVWTGNNLSTANDGVASNLLKNTLQISKTESFTESLEFVQTISSVSYTGKMLNDLALRLGFIPEETSTFYARIKSTIAANTETHYSNVVNIMVTPYDASSDGNYLYLANEALNKFEKKLSSRENNGIYDGFWHMGAWENFLLTNEPSNSASTILGTVPSNGNQHNLYEGNDRWNCWTSNETEAFLYLTADLNTMKWTETVVNSLSVVGDFNDWNTSATPMTYDATTKLWKATITTTVAEPWGIKVLVDESWSFFFGKNEEDGVCNLYKSNADGFPYTVVGTYTLILDLNDPQKFTYRNED